MTVHGIPDALTFTAATWTVELDLSVMGRGIYPNDGIVLEHVADEASKQAGRTIRIDSLPEPQLVGELAEGRKLIGRHDAGRAHVIARRYRWTGQYLKESE